MGGILSLRSRSLLNETLAQKKKKNTSRMIHLFDCGEKKIRGGRKRFEVESMVEKSTGMNSARLVTKHKDSNRLGIDSCHCVTARTQYKC